MQRQRLPNGLQVVTVPLHDTKAVTVFVFAKVGSRYETPTTNGISHFIEHLMFKGTTKRPTTLSIAKLLDGVGAQYNAMTSKDWTGYYVKVSADRTNLALDIVSDILQHATFPPAEIERERGAVLEEINMYEDNPAMALDDVFEQVVFGSHHPLGWSIAGPRQVIRTVSRPTMMAYRHKYYHAKNMLVVVTGRLQPDIQTQIRKFFGTVKSRPTTPKAKPYRVATGVTILARKKPVEQMQIGLGAKAFGYNDRRQPALNLLSLILGGGMSSRLFIQVRERRGLCYDIHTSVSPYEDTGSFLIQAGLDKSRLRQALEVILSEIRKVKTTRITPAELKRAKDQIRGRMTLSFEDSDALASWYGRQGLFAKKIESPDQAVEKLAKVTAAEIQRVAQTIFKPSAMRMAMIGPIDDDPTLRKLIRQV